jgi:glycerol-3-phosphate dehydrogenase subunit B
MITSDAIVIGSELEALVAALKLLEDGASVRILASGAGSLAYSPGGIALLGYGSADKSSPLDDPWSAIGHLAPAHPLRLVGHDGVRDSLSWFSTALHRIGADWVVGDRNRPLVVVSGALRPVLGHPRCQAALSDMAGHRVAVVDLQGFRDFPADLMVAGLRRCSIEAVSVRVASPAEAADSSRLGRFLDHPEHAAAFFRVVRQSLKDDMDIVLFPAVLGLVQHRHVLGQAAEILRRPVFEVATMPPSLSGLRLYDALTREIERRGGLLHLGIRGLRAEIDGCRCKRLHDEEGHEYAAGAYIAGTGGILMAGLDLDSHGTVSEPVFGLSVHQTAPLSQPTPAAAIEALHQAGVEADPDLRPIMADGRCIGNVRVAGTTLAHWNPVREESLEGVAIATGWAAARSAARTGWN